MTNLTYSEILIRYGELSTKGKNRMKFIARLANNIREVLVEWPMVSVKSDRDRTHIFLNGADYGPLSEKLVKVFGVQNFSPAIKVEKTMPALEAAVAELVKKVYLEGMTFKISAKRSDHEFELDSTELNRRARPPASPRRPSRRRAGRGDREGELEPRGGQLHVGLGPGFLEAR